MLLWLVYQFDYGAGAIAAVEAAHVGACCNACGQCEVGYRFHNGEGMYQPAIYRIQGECTRYRRLYGEGTGSGVWVGGEYHAAITHLGYGGP